MDIQISPKLKPLYANLLRIDIGEFLITSQYDHFLIENNLDNSWEQFENLVRSKSNVIMLIPGYTGTATNALGYFLDNIYKQNKRIVFANFIGQLLNEFMSWKGKTVDISKVIKSLENLGINRDELDQIFDEAEFTHSTLPEKSDKELQFNIDKTEIDEKLCFVLMPFISKFDSLYSKILKPVVKKTFKYNCIRADEIFGTKPIIEDVWTYIKKAKFLIADLTDRNPNVFYELGIAHALNKNVILITQDINDVPFDLKHFRCIVYEDSIAGAGKLEEGLKSTIANL